MKMKIVAGLAFLLNAFLFGTYYAVTKEAMVHIDPIVFTFFVMIALIPAALCILAFSWQRLTWQACKSGMLLGSCLCLGLFTLAVALKQNSATSTAFFPSLNGLLAALVSWLFLRKPIAGVTWLAGVISVIGAALLILNTPMGGLRGSTIAFIGGLLCTLYVFLADHEQRDPSTYWPLFGVELLTMAAWACLLGLLFGDWQDLRPTPADVGAMCYIAFGTTFLPTLITVLLQKHISPVTVSFIYILEPILGALVAYVYLGETLPPIGYLGGAMVVVGVLLNTWGTAERPTTGGLSLRWRGAPTARAGQGTLVGVVVPLVCMSFGLFAVYKLGGFPPQAWYTLYDLSLQQAAWPDMTSVTLLVAQALSWLLAWGTLVTMAGLTFYRLYRYLAPPDAPPVRQGIRRAGRDASETGQRLLSEPAYRPARHVVPALPSPRMQSQAPLR
ncbi:MAG: DMT family transporter, partial [Ktedonobacteraceae bacterium]|nr:DMT family transporter [Ktedonobacteraceae bacterium]